jgi:hypothetical protein
MIKIDKDIPIPMAKLVSVTLRALEIGDSFLIEDTSISTRNLILRKTVELKDEGRIFTTSVVQGGIRTWRLE